MDLPDVKDLKGQFENEILPEAEIVIMPYKLKGKVRLEIMNDDLAELAIAAGIIKSDMLDNISWRQVGKLLPQLIELVAQLREETVNEVK